MRPASTRPCRPPTMRRATQIPRLGHAPLRIVPGAPTARNGHDRHCADPARRVWPIEWARWRGSARPCSVSRDDGRRPWPTTQPPSTWPPRAATRDGTSSCSSICCPIRRPCTAPTASWPRRLGACARARRRPRRAIPAGSPCCTGLWCLASQARSPGRCGPPPAPATQRSRRGRWPFMRRRCSPTTSSAVGTLVLAAKCGSVARGGHGLDLRRSLDDEGVVQPVVTASSQLTFLRPCPRDRCRTNVGVGGGPVYGGVYRHRWAVRAQSGLADWEQVNGAQRAR